MKLILTVIDSRWACGCQYLAESKTKGILFSETIAYEQDILSDPADQGAMQWHLMQVGGLNPDGPTKVKSPYRWLHFSLQERGYIPRET